MKLKLFSPRTRDALIAALLLILLCGIAVGILSSTRTPDDPISLDAGEKTDRLSLCLEEGDAIFLRFQDTKEEPFLIDYVLEK